MSPEPPVLPFFVEPAFNGKEVISLDDEITECRRAPTVEPFVCAGTMRPALGTL